MKISAPQFRTWRWISLLAAVLALPAILTGASRIQSDTTDVAQWLPAGSPARRTYEEFAARFGGDEFLIISWLGCTLDDPRVPRLAELLRRHVATESEGAAYFQEVNTGPEELAALTSSPILLKRAEALERLEGILVGPDHETTCLIVEMSDAGRMQQHAVIDLVTESAVASGVSAGELRLGGSVYEAVIVDRSSESSFDKFLLPSGVISLVLCFWCLRSIRLTVIVLATAVYAHLLSMAVLYYASGSLNAVLVVMPTLVYVLTISGGIHLANYYRDALRAGQENTAAALSALRSGWFPCTLASVSTAVGLGSLAVSRIAPVRDFGIYSALAMLAALAILLFLLTALLSIGSGHSKGGAASAHAEGGIGDRTAGWTMRFATSLTLLGLAALGGSSLGLPRLSATVRFEEMFTPENEIIRNYSWLEEAIGPTVPVEVVLHIPGESRLTTVERLEMLRRVQAALQRTLPVGGVLSAATFVGEIPPAESVSATVQRRIMDRSLRGRLNEFVDNGFLALEREGQLWRITVRASALTERDYGEFVESVRETTARLLQHDPETRGEGVSITCTGLAPVIDEAQLQLFDDLVKSFTTAFFLVYPIMAVLMRSIAAGMVAMIPNVLPAAIVFGGMGWMGDGVDIGSVLCASVALGIAVDDTVHFLTWYRYGVRAGMERSEAVRSAYRNCSSAMFQTTLVCSFGMLVFRLSDFVPAQRFASLMFLLLWLSVAADLILLPALITGPFRIFFAAQRESRRAAKEPREAVTSER